MKALYLFLLGIVVFSTGVYCGRETVPKVTPVRCVIQVAPPAGDAVEAVSTAMDSLPDEVDGHLNYFKVNLFLVRKCHEFPALERNLPEVYFEGVRARQNRGE